MWPGVIVLLVKRVEDVHSALLFFRDQYKRKTSALLCVVKLNLTPRHIRPLLIIHYK